MGQATSAEDKRIAEELAHHRLQSERMFGAVAARDDKKVLMPSHDAQERQVAVRTTSLNEAQHRKAAQAAMAMYEGPCMILQLPRNLMVLLAGLVVERKTAQSVATLGALARSCKRLHEVVFSQDCMRLLCEYDRVIDANGFVKLRELELFSRDTIDSVSDQFKDWRFVFVEKWRNRCTACQRLVWMDELNEGCSVKGRHVVPTLRVQIVMSALERKDQQMRAFVSDSLREQDGLMCRIDPAKFQVRENNDDAHLESSQNWDD
jgi:hypothetical protein